jgi:hypothetical protein
MYKLDENTDKIYIDRMGVELDENIAPIIHLLRMKGYETLFSCSDHMWNDNNDISYISDYVVCYVVLSGHHDISIPADIIPPNLDYGFKIDVRCDTHIESDDILEESDKYQHYGSHVTAFMRFDNYDQAFAMSDNEILKSSGYPLNRTNYSIQRRTSIHVSYMKEGMEFVERYNNILEANRIMMDLVDSLPNIK